MNIHEYQAKQVLKGYGAPVADGVAIFEASEAEAAAKSLPGPLYVVKSQIHAGGRGKGKFRELPSDAKGGSGADAKYRRFSGASMLQEWNSPRWERLADTSHRARKTNTDEEVIQYYQYAADKGDNWALVSLARLYIHGGRGLAVDYAHAYKLLGAAANSAAPCMCGGSRGYWAISRVAWR